MQQWRGSDKKVHIGTSFFPLPAMKMPVSAPRSENPGYAYGSDSC